MSEHERGAYTPPTAGAPLSFDPRQPVRGASPIPLTLILSVIVLAALVAAIFVFYRAGVRQAAGAPEIVGTPVDGIKYAATAETQPLDPAAGLQIYKSDGDPLETAPAEPSFVSPPEIPQARPTAPVTVVPATPATAVQAPRPGILASPPAKVTPATLETIVPAIVKAPPAKPVPTVALPAKVLPPKTPTIREAKPVSGGGAVVQIGAVSSPSLADKAWKEAIAAAPGLGVGKGKSVEKIERNGGTLYRTAVTGFSSKADAKAFCVKLQAAGKSCFVR